MDRLSALPCTWSSRRSSATLATEVAEASVLVRKSWRSWAEISSPSGIATTASSTVIRASTATAIRCATTARLSGSSHVGEPETAPVDGLDQPRDPELAAQRGHVHVEHLGRAVPVRVPGGLEDVLPGLHAARVDGQALQDVELLRGQRHLNPVHQYFVRPQIDSQ